MSSLLLGMSPSRDQRICSVLCRSRDQTICSVSFVHKIKRPVQFWFVHKHSCFKRPQNNNDVSKFHEGQYCTKLDLDLGLPDYERLRDIIGAVLNIELQGLERYHKQIGMRLIA